MRRIIFHLMLYFSILACTLVLAEAVLRISGRVTTQGVHTAPEEDFHRIPGMFEPSQNVVERPRRELSHRVSINSLGFRGPDIRREKPPGIVRIFCIGDSLTYGSFVNGDETFPSYLQSVFVQNKIPVEVVNGGVGGTTIIDQLYFLKKGIEIEPDIVLLMFSENDIDDLGRWEPMYVSLEKNRRIKSTPIIRPMYWMFRDTALFNFGLLLRSIYMEGVRDREIPGRRGEVNRRGDVDREDLWRRYEELFREMKAYAEHNGIQFVFSIFPGHYRMEGESAVKRAALDRLERAERLGRENGVATVNLLPALKRANMAPNELYLLPYDGHPSKAAYFIVANAIFEQVEGKVREILLANQTSMVVNDHGSAR